MDFVLLQASHSIDRRMLKLEPLLNSIDAANMSCQRNAAYVSGCGMCEGVCFFLFVEVFQKSNQMEYIHSHKYLIYETSISLLSDWNLHRIVVVIYIYSQISDTHLFIFFLALNCTGYVWCIVNALHYIIKSFIMIEILDFCN